MVGGARARGHCLNRAQADISHLHVHPLRSLVQHFREQKGHVHYPYEGLARGCVHVFFFLTFL